MARAPGLTITVIYQLHFLVLCRATESPQYEVIHAESDFEIRHDRHAAWMSATVNHAPFVPKGHLNWLSKYIQGANLNYSLVAMTSPLVTSLVPGAGPLHSSTNVVRYYLPAKLQDRPPTPPPELNLEPYTWKSHYVAVRKFSGFATDDCAVERP